MQGAYTTPHKGGKSEIRSDPGKGPWGKILPDLARVIPSQITTSKTTNPRTASKEAPIDRKNYN